ncbi:tetratricopeptide repeat protein [Cesiribacter andamanensis]|uniref:tetratricopeptide repeat protein n=1 Tax=Cesiribacter andamanensis TaxID=649507 RepID=UPI00034AD399|nr:tetratricopeptide repeat protein [Cesiribacter andamanensis]
MLPSVGQAQQRTAHPQADSLLNWAQNNYEADLATALDAARQALHLAQEQKLDVYLCRSYAQLGRIYNNVAFYTKAMEEFHKGLGLAQEKALPDQEAELLSLIGNVYYYEDSLQQAIVHYQQSLEITKVIKNLPLLARNLGNLGLAYSRQGTLEKAELYIRQALHLNRQLADSIGICVNYSSLGSLYLNQHQLDSARHYYGQSLRLALKIKDTREMVYGYLSNARLERNLHNNAVAKRHLLNALRISTHTSLNNERKRCLRELSQLEEEAGNFQAALYYNRQYSRLSDSLSVQAQRSEQQQLQHLLQAERNISENRILKANVAAREHELRASLANQERQTAATMATITALVFLAGLLAFFYYHYRQNNKNHAQLKHMHAAIKSQAQELEQAYDKIHQHNLQLENNIAERTRQLNQQNRQLIQYAFFNAHKVRGPLARILGLVNLLPKAEHDTEFNFIMQRLEDSARELDKVVHEINLILEAKHEHQDN